MLIPRKGLSGRPDTYSLDQTLCAKKVSPKVLGAIVEMPHIT